MSIQYTADQLQRKFPGPPGAPGFSRLAEVLRTEGKTEAAIQLCQEGLRVRPNTLSAYLVLGKALMDVERMEDAREQFEAALRLDSRCLSAMHFLAKIMTKMQWADGAAGYYRSILELDPWDADIRALLGEAAPGAKSYQGNVPSALAPSPFDAPAHPAGEDTFHKPDGLAGDVLEVNLNDMAADFLPGDADTASMGLVEESLEDALSAPSSEHAPQADAPQDAFTRSEEARKPSVPESLNEPRPLDVFKEESSAPADAMGEDGPPISGQDVEDRLDSLFGIDDAPSASMRSSSATWSPAPAEASEPEIDFSPSDAPGPEASATATGEMRATDTGEIPVRPADDFLGSQTTIQTGSASLTEDLSPLDLDSVPDMPKPAAEAISVDDYSAVDFVAPTAPSHADASGEDAEESGRVQGEDIERRLDELFNLTEEDDRPPAAASTIASASLPVAPGPKVQEAVSMGETVAFGGEVAFRETDAAATAFVTPEEAASAGAGPAVEDTITGQDVADKLDDLFGLEPSAPMESGKDAAMTAFASAPAVEADPIEDSFEEMDLAAPDAPLTLELPAAARETSAEPRSRAEDEESAMPPEEADAYPELKPWRPDPVEPPAPPAGDVMSTESMLPPGWFGQAGDGPSITGSDVEAQLDKLFHLEEDGETAKPAAPLGRSDVNTGDTATFMAPTARELETPQRKPMPGDESDMTVMMPAMTEPAPAQDTRLPKDAGRIKESVADWLARQNEEADQRSAKATGSMFKPGADAGETMILPSESVSGAGDEADMFGTLAPDDMAALSETASIEMVDGVDVAERLDELFADEGTASVAAKAAAGSEMSLFTPETDDALDIPPPEGLADDGVVSGEDVSSRMEDMFGTGATAKSADPAGAPSVPGVPGASETDEEMLPAADFGKPAAQPAPELAPMTDEEDGYPEEEEMAAGTGPGANVATVTLAEIYFQQGLREQALQIYRQLLEREPENESVRKRIEEIEAVKPEGGAGGPGSDPRRPRPGLKVPKRKK